ncbi:hypothetical protein Scep_009863 [Stephania cephalantha]|uniref:Uncharacterized protein n=1 Tax=Stephania cephalantha TaxID=152367 RepID=A0AAP0PDI9_9MAGN
MESRRYFCKANRIKEGKEFSIDLEVETLQWLKEVVKEIERPQPLKGFKRYFHWNQNVSTVKAFDNERGFPRITKHRVENHETNNSNSKSSNLFDPHRVVMIHHTNAWTRWSKLEENLSKHLGRTITTHIIRDDRAALHLQSIQRVMEKELRGEALAVNQWSIEAQGLRAIATDILHFQMALVCKDQSQWRIECIPSRNRANYLLEEHLSTIPLGDPIVTRTSSALVCCLPHELRGHGRWIDVNLE